MSSIWESKQPFLTLRIIFKIMTTFFAIGGLLKQPYFHISGVFFSLGLLFAVEGIEMLVMKKRKHIMLTIIASLFLITVATYSLLK